ncbi:MAG: ATP-binding protein [Blautia sp.]|jgi:two-component system phosphate regulon sensor histidine kinase PhoR
MREKILKSMTAFIAASILLTFLFLMGLMYRQADEQMRESVQNESGYICQAIERAGTAYLDDTVGNLTSSRITLISSGGEILYDSVKDAEAMENHKDRPEFIQAAKEGVGESTRLSATLGRTTYYYAVRLDGGDILRVAKTTNSVFMTIRDSIVPLGLIFVILTIPAILLAKKQTERLVQPVNQLNLEQPLENDVYEELSPLLHRINKQNEQIAAQMQELKNREEEYQAITENMKDGLVVTNRSVILSINRCAANLFHLTKDECLQQNILVLGRSLMIKECLERALEGVSNHRMVTLDGRSYQVLGNPVRVDGIVEGAVLFLLDMTEKEETERIRREFSANVSHELKTPLMSIMGYAELMMNHLVKPQDQDEFAGRIYKEAKRLSTLVEDIIKLSRLDEGQVQDFHEKVDMWSVAKDVREHLSEQAHAQKLHFSLEGEPFIMEGNTRILYEILYNLCDNAMKYNHPDGEVTVHLNQKDGEAVIMVEDTGSGIPKEEQERIFERFYRVDKSRSRQVNGTGLGLSIVKHGVQLHNGRIQLESAPGEGTKISVYFPVRSHE